VRRLLGATITISLLSLLNQIVTFGIQVVTASLFGSRAEMDAFLTAATLPAYATALLVGGTVYVLIPVFVEFRTKKNDLQAWQIASSVITLYLIAAVLFMMIGIAFARPLLAITVPGLPPATLSLATKLVPITWPSAVVTGLVLPMTGLYHARESFRWPALTPVLGGLANLGLVASLAPHIGAYGLSLAVLASNVLQLALLGSTMRGHLAPRLGLRDPDVRRALHLFWPLMLGALFAQAASPIERYVASGMAAGSIAHLGYASRLNAALMSLLSAGIAVTFFPTMSRYSARNDLAGLRHSVSLGMRTTWFVVAPTVALGVAMARPLIGIVLQRGAFAAADTAAVATILPWYLLALIATTQGNITARALYALKNTRAMLWICVGEIIIYAAVASFTQRFGPWGVAAAMGVAANASFCMQCTVLWMVLKRPRRLPVVIAFTRILVAAVVAFVAARATSDLLTKPLLSLLCGGIAGTMAYAIALIVLRAGEWKMLVALVQRRRMIGAG
jgi:putative peptidoglycan lipid II flippase